ncbi:hypothetical protein [Gluconobacter sphaericus]|uniref:Uncharacterized protein n=2 Tax=Gluconobacter sphaericus TaxID=574987 RepID=A0AA37W8F7_9PROT|nr:hypothetical protein [Gluconobacter sphaericus]MBF0885777.1 hypothetical protein [Gluconobacter sphaericus]MBS1086554.1 hypothetical protein [Gluconobacter sphaericus]MBS1100594.1 hypothetical protein [Gluconobacter sphaericus]QQX91539.1 hypothetical protein IGS75_02625 [Gluconobacter sphaericus]GEB42865.1 hypothetical protein GSP01_16470 [Gluconobacter sphaericus NBRC 12467]
MKKFAFASFVLAMSVSAAEAAPCVYDMTPLPVTQGIVSGIAPTGVKLRDGTTIILPEEFLAGVRLNRRLAVRGLVSTTTHTVQAFALEGNPPVCPSAPTIPRGPFAGSPAYDAIHP